MSKSLPVHVRYKCLDISLPSSAKHQREMTKSYAFWRTWTTMGSYLVYRKTQLTCNNRRKKDKRTRGKQWRQYYRFLERCSFVKCTVSSHTKKEPCAQWLIFRVFPKFEIESCHYIFSLTKFLDRWGYWEQLYTVATLRNPFFTRRPPRRRLSLCTAAPPLKKIPIFFRGGAAVHRLRCLRRHY